VADPFTAAVPLGLRIDDEVGVVEV